MRTILFIGEISAYLDLGRCVNMRIVPSCAVVVA
jgi:hypothetical protein